MKIMKIQRRNIMGTNIYQLEVTLQAWTPCPLMSTPKKTVPTRKLVISAGKKKEEKRVRNVRLESSELRNVSLYHRLMSTS